MSEEIIIVDEQDNVLAYKDRKEMNLKDIYRVSALWLTNYQGDVLLSQRAYDKKHHPGKWGPAVAGTIEKGETYDSNIIKEAEEEIGLKNVSFKKGPKELNQKYYNHYTQWYTATVDMDIKDFVIQAEEVVEVRWFSKDELIKKVDIDPEFFTPNFPHYFKLFDK